MPPENGISGGDESRATGIGKRNDGMAKGPKETRIRRCIRAICRSMDTYWVPGVNNVGNYGRWAFAEFTDVWLMQEDFVRQIALFFDRTIASVVDSHLSGAMP